MATGTLTSQTIAATYKSLLKIAEGANAVLHATTHQLVEDGDGNNSVLSLAQDSVGITGSGKKLYFSDKGGEYISGDSTDLTIASGGALNLTATTDIVVPANVGITFGTGEKIEGDSTNLTLTSGAEINLDCTTLDIYANADVSGTLTVGGVLTVNNGAIFNEASASVDFRVESNGNANALFVDGSANNIGIGTSSPDAASSLYIQGNGTGNSTNAWIYIDGAQDSGLKILDGGTMRWEIFNSTGSSDRLYIRDEESDTGVYIAQDATDWTSLSDISLKTDITSISNALSKVNSIRGVNFKWKKYKPDGSKPIPSRDRNRIGCIAQEVNEVLPEAVDTSKDGEWGVSYSTLIPLLVEAVKELSVSNDALKARIEVLEAA